MASRSLAMGNGGGAVRERLQNILARIGEPTAGSIYIRQGLYA